MGKKLLEKAGLVGLPKPASVASAIAPPIAGSAPASSAGPTLAEPARPKTAPGTMLGFMAAQSAAVQEADQLRARLQSFDGATPARRLDPRQVLPSRWANRHEHTYADAAFATLKADIAASGGNVQAIKVRPLPAAVPSPGVGQSNPPAPADSPRYEIVFGHRRHRACLELGLPVLAVVEDLSEQALFVEMERENRARKDLSAWEQGSMYARALDQGLYPSNRQLALAIGRDLGDVGKALALARLPSVVVEAFASPLDLQFRWAKPLSDAQQKDPEALLARANAVRDHKHRLNARQVMEALVGQGVGRSNGPVGQVIERDGAAAAVLTTDARGRLQVQFEVLLDEHQRKKLVKAIEGLLG